MAATTVLGCVRLPSWDRGAVGCCWLFDGEAGLSRPRPCDKPVVLTRSDDFVKIDELIHRIMLDPQMRRQACRTSHGTKPVKSLCLHQAARRRQPPPPPIPPQPLTSSSPPRSISLVSLFLANLSPQPHHPNRSFLANTGVRFMIRLRA